MLYQFTSCGGVVGWCVCLVCSFIALPPHTHGQILLIVAAVKRSALLFTIWAVIVGTVLLPATTHWQGFLDSYLFTTWRQYFNFSFVSTSAGGVLSVSVHS